MPDTPQLLLFMGAGMLLNLTPGPDVLFILSQSLRGGLRQGFVAALGITVGCFVHLAASALGLAAMLAASENLFNSFKWMGAAYLLWLGFRLLRHLSNPAWGIETSASMVPSVSAKKKRPTLGAVFWQALATNVFNPKVALFFLAFLPQFTPANSPNATWTFVVLGCIFNFNGFLICMAWALGASWLSKSERCKLGMAYLDRLAGLMFVGFGIKLALASAPEH